VLVALAGGASIAVQAARAQQDVVLTASDGVKVYGTYYPAPGAERPIILLFHQAGSNRWEYAPIAPKLVAAGFSCLAIDQRADEDSDRPAGQMWGHANETIAHLGKSASFLDALEDLEAALAWARARDPHRKVIIWGSSYSASLVFLLAAKHPGEVAGLLSFSPGEYFPDKHMVEDAAAKVTVPVFVTSAKDSSEIARARAIVDAVANKATRTQYVPTVAGVHGSSTLRTDRDPQGAASNWQAVLAFLLQFG
jgi:dienelactone hydrolase